MTRAVEIDHLDSVYLVPPGHPEPQQVRWQLDRVARTRLDAALALALAELFDPEDELVCVIDELEVDIALDVDADEDALAAAWAQAIVAAIRMAVDEPSAGDGVHVFASRAAQLAAFLADLAEGRAWDRGCYTAFDGLRALPSQATAREALVRDPETSRAALAQLAGERRLDRVLVALGEREAELVAAALAAGGTATPAAVEAVLEAWPEVGGGPEGRRPPDAADALRLAALAAGGADPASVVAAARALVAIAAAHAAGESVRAEALLQELARHDLRLAEAVDEVVSAAAARPTPGTLVGTAYAGVFLLLQGLLVLDADRVLAALVPGEPELAPLRLALLARCLGTPDAAADAGLRIAAGGADDLEDEPARDVWDRGQRLLLERLARLGRADGRKLLLERVEGEDVVLVRDAERDAWLALVDAATAEAQAVRLVTEVLGREPEAVEWSAEPSDLDGPAGTLTLLARAVLRELAVRLPGLERSSAAYLRENFLVGPGMIRVDGDVLDVQLPPSPLRIVLQLAGVHGRPLAVPWLGEVVLRLPDP